MNIFVNDCCTFGVLKLHFFQERIEPNAKYSRHHAQNRFFFHAKMQVYKISVLVNQYRGRVMQIIFTFL